MRIRYGISNCYYAIATQGAGGALTYAAPVAMPGAVAISLEASGEEFTEWADNVEWFKQALNNGYNGTLELEELPESFRTDVLGEEKDSADVLFENSKASMKEFALLWQFEIADDANVTGKRTALFRCKASRPGISGTTKRETITPDHETINISAMPRINDNYVKASAESTSSKYANWFQAVVTKSA